MHSRRVLEQYISTRLGSLDQFTSEFGQLGLQDAEMLL